MKPHHARSPARALPRSGKGLNPNPHVRQVVGYAGHGIVEVVAGASCTYCIDSQGWIFVTGERRGSGVLDQATPERVPGISLAVSSQGSKGACPLLAQGGKHTLALTDTREVYSWGCNGGGQLGLGVKGEDQIKLPSPSPNPPWLGCPRRGPACPFKQPLFREGHHSRDRRGWGA